jgi:hypothetical protein
MNLVRSRTIFDRRIACSRVSVEPSSFFCGSLGPYIFEDNAAEAVYYEHEWFLQSCQTLAYVPITG